MSYCARRQPRSHISRNLSRSRPRARSSPVRSNYVSTSSKLLHPSSNKIWSGNLNCIPNVLNIASASLQSYVTSSQVERRNPSSRQQRTSNRNGWSNILYKLTEAGLTVILDGYGDHATFSVRYCLKIVFAVPVASTFRSKLITGNFLTGVFVVKSISYILIWDWFPFNPTRIFMFSVFIPPNNAI